MLGSKMKSFMLLAGAVILLLVFLSWTLISKSSSSQIALDPRHLSGIQTGPMPWLPEIKHLLSRLKATSLPALSQEGHPTHTSSTREGVTSKLMVDATVKSGFRGEVAEPTKEMRGTVLRHWKEYVFGG